MLCELQRESARPEVLLWSQYGNKPMLDNHSMRSPEKLGNGSIGRLRPRAGNDAPKSHMTSICATPHQTTAGQ